MERLLDKLMNQEGSRIWILNRKYCPILIRIYNIEQL